MLSSMCWRFYSPVLDGSDSSKSTPTSHVQAYRACHTQSRHIQLSQFGCFYHKLHQAACSKPAFENLFVISIPVAEVYTANSPCHQQHRDVLTLQIGWMELVLRLFALFFLRFDKFWNQQVDAPGLSLWGSPYLCGQRHILAKFIRPLELPLCFAPNLTVDQSENWLPAPVVSWALTAGWTVVFPLVSNLFRIYPVITHIVSCCDMFEP